MAAGDLTSAANVKSWIGKADAGADALLARLVSSASAWITQVTSRDFSGVKSYSEIRDGSGGTEMLLANWPVAAITTLAVNAVAVPAQPADGQAGYFLVRGEVLALAGYAFSRGRKNVRVTYTAGYSSVPLDLEQACIELVAAEYARGARGTPELESKGVGVGGENFRWRLDAVPASISRVIDAYSKRVPL